jgi:hypothetical protein
MYLNGPKPLLESPCFDGPLEKRGIIELYIDTISV